MTLKHTASVLLLVLFITSSGCAKLQNEREFDTSEHALAFELESNETAARLTATIQSNATQTAFHVELSMSNDDTDYISEPVRLESGSYTITSVSVYNPFDTPIYSCTNLSVTLESDATVSLD